MLISDFSTGFSANNLGKIIPCLGAQEDLPAPIQDFSLDLGQIRGEFTSNRAGGLQAQKEFKDSKTFSNRSSIWFAKTRLSLRTSLSWPAPPSCEKHLNLGSPVTGRTGGTGKTPG